MIREGTRRYAKKRRSFTLLRVPSVKYKFTSRHSHQHRVAGHRKPPYLFVDSALRFAKNRRLPSFEKVHIRACVTNRTCKSSRFISQPKVLTPSSDKEL